MLWDHNIRNFNRSIWSLVMLGLWFTVASMPSVFGASGPAIELVPVIVWQGEEIKEWQVAYVRDVLAASGELKFVHMIDPATLMMDAQRGNTSKSTLSNILREGDGVGMHVALWQNWLAASGSSSQIFKSLYNTGTFQPNGRIETGLRASVTSLDAASFSKFIAYGRKIMGENGFGTPSIVYFDEGAIPDSHWSLTRELGLKYDWSGFHLESTQDLLGMSPLYAWNLENMAAMKTQAGENPEFNGRSLDHTRFGLVVEIMSLSSMRAVAQGAIQFARKQERSVLVPIILNGATAVHHVALTNQIMSDVRSMASEANVAVKNWSGDHNSSWDINKIRPNMAGQNLVGVSGGSGMESPGFLMQAPALIVDAQEPQFVPSKEPTEAVQANAPPVAVSLPEIVPAQQNLVPSHAQYMSH